jgi:hypothetical protein
MNREEFLKAFAEMSPEDQEAILTELTKQGGAEEAKTACSLAAMKKHMRKMMEKMLEGGGPMAWCAAMMKGKCCEGHNTSS